MRQYPDVTDKYDMQDLERINAEQWQLDCLEMNPAYCWWGNFEDYMSKQGSGWDSRCDYTSFSEMWELDELNECVNFYFEVHRESEPCETCEQSGYNSETKQLSDGHGYIYTEPNAKLALQLWILHPRKGCSRGVYINEIKQDELPQVYTFLNGAAERNAERFSRIPK